MSDLSPIERMAKLRALEAWLDYQLRDTRRKIEEGEKWLAASGAYITEQERKAGQAVGATLHAADCAHIVQPVAVLDEAKARFALNKDSGFMHPCEHCHPEKALLADWD
ncbi:DUF6233 domain-containing protein [Streptomyces sp. NPDC093272]|uniref:DUF6233 domain-containing protein n=1 Tax=Streptomyces sp. NPDC093272 TaxID=3154981 RepID=UPI00341B1735